MKKAERERIQKAIEQSPLTEQEWLEMEPWSAFICSCAEPSHHREIYNMGKTIAQAFKDEGALERSRDFLLLLLRAKFKTVPDRIVAEIYTTEDIRQFDVWGLALMKARRITNIPFKS